MLVDVKRGEQAESVVHVRHVGNILYLAVTCRLRIAEVGNASAAIYTVQRTSLTSWHLGVTKGGSGSSRKDAISCAAVA